jgi:NAD-dependent dihydropyrimidine dehydrogenase PreA subunit
MQGLRYLEDAVTLQLDAEKCTGCRVCTFVCPHGVFAMRDRRAYLADRGACMECGACAVNCASGAISVKPGVGCAEAIIHSWIFGGEPSCGCSTVPGATPSGACCGGEPSEPASAGAVGCCDSTPAPDPCCSAEETRGGSCC